MTDRELYVERRNMELPKFERVMAALPKDKLAYKPHERSPTTLQILTTLVAEHDSCARLVAAGKTDFTPPPLKSVGEAVAAFEKNWDELDRQVAAMAPADWDKNGQFFSGGKMVSDQPIGGFLWFILFDAIHHRGQLSTYIRPMGGKVPAIYGPSADSR